jgi:hypothetical protein
MYAYAPDGTPIVATKDITPGTAGIVEGGFKLDSKGQLDCEHDGETELDYDAQATVVNKGQQMVVDDDGEDWPVCALVLLDKPLGQGEGEDGDDDEDAELPADKVKAAYEALDAWQNGAYETAATDPSASTGAAAPAVAPGDGVIDLVADDRILVRATGIEWDTTSDDDAEHPDTMEELKPLLPSELTVRVNADIDLEDGQLSDLLSDRYGFCISSIGSVERL